MFLPRLACLDLDTFFVSVERLLDPTLVGRPVVVGGRTGDRGVVTSCSYEVRELGVRSGMSLRDAVRLAPNAHYIPTQHGVYGAYAARVKAVLEQWCPVVRTASIDEFFLDFHGCEGLYREPGDADGDATIERVVRAMRADVQACVGLPASVGIGVSRALAKMASGRAKPAGVLMVRAGQEHAFVDLLPARRLPGIGPVAEGVLVAAGIATLGQLRTTRHEDARVRGMAVALADALRPSGPLPERERPAFLEHDDVPEGALSNERTFFSALGDLAGVEAALQSLVERVTWRLRRRGGVAHTITLKLRFADFTTLSRGRSGPPTNSEVDVWHVARALLHGAWDQRRRVRLLGVQLSNLGVSEPQMPLFPPARPRAGVALDAIRERFGYDAVRLGAVAGFSPRQPGEKARVGKEHGDGALRGHPSAQARGDDSGAD